MYRLYMYSGASLLRTLYMNIPLLYSGCFCRLIILISVNFWSVVRVVSGKINLTVLLCREFISFCGHYYIRPTRLTHDQCEV